MKDKLVLITGGTGAGAFATDPLFTGQVYDGDTASGGTGLYFYNARYYDPVLGRFTQADIIVPDPATPMSFDRYIYTRNNPLRYTDSIGHCEDNTNWCWHNRWYNARGYFWDGTTGHWTRRGTPYFWNSETYMETAVNSPWVLQGEVDLEFVLPLITEKDFILSYYNRIHGRYTDLEVFTRISDFVAGLSQGDKRHYMLQMNDFILRAGGNRQALIAGPWARRVDSAVLERFEATGFAANDESNQVNHFWYSVALTVSWGPTLPTDVAELHEDNNHISCKLPVNTGLAGCGGGTVMDLELSYQAIALGKMINANTIELYQIGNWLRRSLSP